MKKIALILLLPLFLIGEEFFKPTDRELLQTTAHPEIKLKSKNYKYIRTGFTTITDGYDFIIAPSVGCGFRNKQDFFGYDFSLSFSNIYLLRLGSIPVISGKGQANLYFSKNPNSLYTGLSIDAVTGFAVVPPLFYEQFLLGYEWKDSSDKFHFFNVGINLSSQIFSSNLPLPVSLEYGFSF